MWSTAAPILNNIVKMVSFIAYALLSSSNQQLAILVLALGGTFSVFVQMTVQIPRLRKRGIRLTPHINFHDSHIKETLIIGAPTLGVEIESFITTSVINSSVLSVTAHGASIIYYARLWYILPYSILALPIITALFTELSDHIAHGDMQSYKRDVREGVSRIVFMLVPFALFLITFAPELIAILGAGRFDDADAALSVQYLQLLAINLPFYGVYTYLQKVCSSCGVSACL